MSVSGLARRPQTLYQERVHAEASTVAAISATATVPLRTVSRDFAVDRFEIEVPGGYTSDASNYYDVSLQLKPATFTAVAATDVCTSTAHGMATGDAVQVTNSGGGLPGGLSAGVTYYMIVLTANTFKLATSAANAAAGTAIDITTAGTGTQSIAKVLAMYSLITTTGNGDLVDLVFGAATLMPNPIAAGGSQINVVLTKFGTAANVAAGSRLVAHLRLL